MHIAALFALANPGRSANQPRTVCEVLNESSELSGQLVRVRGMFTGSPRHGYSVSQSADEAPCPGWRRNFLTSPPSILLWWRAQGGPAVSPSEQHQNEEVFQRAGARYNKRDFHPVEIEVLGRLIRKPITLIFRKSNGSYFGNGYGASGGYQAALQIEEIREK